MEDLKGEIVLVHPKLPVDPAHSQGNIGIITDIDIAKDEVNVRFVNGKAGLYSSDALLVMKGPNELYKDILVNGKDQLNKEEYKTVLRANMMQGAGSLKMLVDAMDMIKTNDNTIAFSTVSLQDKIALSLSKDQAATQAAGFSR